MDELEAKLNETWGPTNNHWTLCRHSSGWMWFCGNPQKNDGIWKHRGTAKTAFEAMNMMLDCYDRKNRIKGDA